MTDVQRLGYAVWFLVFCVAEYLYIRFAGGRKET